jgi:hypothetical protein
MPDLHLPLPLDEPFEMAGEWWAPDNPDEVAFGRLVYSPTTGLELHLASGSDVIRVEQPADWLHGLTVQGRRVTLRKCFARNWRMSIPGGIEARVHAGQAFVGMHAASDRELAMLSLSARIRSLNEWLGHSGISVSAFRGRPMRFRYSHPNDLPLLSIAQTYLSASFELTGEATPPRTPFSLNIEQRAWLQVRPRRRRSFDDLWTLVNRFNRLLSFASGTDCEALEVVGEARVPVEEFTGRVIWQTAPVWVLYERVSVATDAQAPERMLFRYEDARRDSLRPISRWFRRSQELEPVTNVYLSALPTRPLNIEYRFLAFVQALEAYHRRKQPRQLTLQTRLDRLVAALPAKVRRHVPPDFSSLAKDTRNYFTHWDPKLEKRAAKGAKLVALTVALKLLFDLTLLRELGFTQTAIADAALDKNQRLVREMQRGFLELEP